MTNDSSMTTALHCWTATQMHWNKNPASCTSLVAALNWQPISVRKSREKEATAAKVLSILLLSLSFLLLCIKRLKWHFRKKMLGDPVWFNVWSTVTYVSNLQRFWDIITCLVCVTACNLYFWLNIHIINCRWVHYHILKCTADSVSFKIKKWKIRQKNANIQPDWNHSVEIVVVRPLCSS